MQREAALYLEPGVTIHCHRTLKGGVLVRPPYEKDGYVMLDCALHNTLQEGWGWPIKIDQDNLDQYPVELTLDHTTTSNCSSVGASFLGEMRLCEFVDKVAPVFEKMGWEWVGKDKLHVPAALEIHEHIWDRLEHMDKHNVFETNWCRIFIRWNQPKDPEFYLSL